MVFMIVHDFSFIFDINHYLDHEFDAGVSKIGFSIEKHVWGTCFHGIWTCLGSWAHGPMGPWAHGPNEKFKLFFPEAFLTCFCTRSLNYFFRNRC